MKKIKLIAKILTIIIICLVGFVGIYLPWKQPIEMNNLVKEYNLSKDLKGYREIILKVSDANKVLDADKKVIGDTDSYNDDTIKEQKYTKSDEKVNSSEVLNEQNYEKSKSIIEKRLSKFGVQDYNLSMDKQSGTIYIQIPEDTNTDRVVNNITQTGSVELKDSKDDSKVYLKSENLKEAKVLYNQETTGTAVYMSLQFNKEGKEILKNISENEYKTLPEKDTDKSEDANTEEDKEADDTDESKKEDSTESSSSEENKEEQKQVTLYISGSAVTTTSFDEPVETGNIDLRTAQPTTDSDALQNSITSAQTISALLNNGVLPIKYNVKENQYVKTDIKAETVKKVIIAVAVIVAILLIYMIKKHKTRGILATISYIGFVSLYTILLRVFNVTIALEGIAGGIIILVLNYLVNMKLLEVNGDKKEYYKSYLDIIMKLLPIFAISIIFVFIPVTTLASIGMTLFWGIVLMLAYNVTLTKNIVD
ncbi:MAG: hypothetical protein ILA02_05690 [Clostridia bacterium]|nr:hypothetical protein [Clostridia bacterium]